MIGNSGKLPDFIIIGAMKCGTTSLHYYLNQHPEIYMSRVKELNFFADQGNWSHGIDWYKAQFSTRRAICGEASPLYSDYPRAQNVPARIHTVVPDAKLIYLVRDPVQRIQSQYLQLLRSGKERRSINEALSDFERSRLVAISRYAFQLSFYLPYFSTDNILVIRSSDLWHNRVDTLKRIFRFLEVDEDFYSSRFKREKHVTASKRMLRPTGHEIWNWIGGRLGSIHSGLSWHVQRVATWPLSLPPAEKPLLDEGLQRELIAYLRLDAVRLTALTGIDTSDWMRT